MSASAEMPYFINPSLNLNKAKKKEAYEQVLLAIEANLFDAKDDLMKMVTINCILKTYLPYFYWVGFYLIRNNRLEIGPYQGTLGCLYIEFDKGVCGKTVRLRETQIVDDCHTLSPGSEHIACDPNSKSEIVVPVFDKTKEIIGVLDVDSTNKRSFDEMDKHYLEHIVYKYFSEK